MSQARILFWIMVLMLGMGLAEGGGGPDSDARLILGLTVTYLCFLWYRADSDARGYRRSGWLSVGVVAFALGAIPYYLMRSRAEGERRRAVMVFAACALLALLVERIGMAIHLALLF